MATYSTAVIGGGGPNIYDRLLNDSTENLLRPTAQMIGSANRISASFYSQKPWTGGVKRNGRQLASANIRKRSAGRPGTFNNAYANVGDSSNILGGPRAFSSQGARTMNNSRLPPAGAMYATNKTMRNTAVGAPSFVLNHQQEKKKRNQSSNVYSKALFNSVYDRHKSNPQLNQGRTTNYGW